MQTIIVSHRGDLHADAVMWGIKRLGREAIFLDVFRPFDDGRMTLSINADAGLGLQIDKVKIEPGAGVWFRRPIGQQFFNPSAVHPDDLEFAGRASQYFFGELTTFLSDNGFCINNIRAALRAERKHVQLAAALQAGLNIPKTIVTNDSSEAAAFAKRRRAISKNFRPFQQRANAEKELVRRREEAERKAREEQERREREARQALLGQAQALREANEIRALVSSIRAKGAGVNPHQLEEWSTWALGVADRLDPLSDLAAVFASREGLDTDGPEDEADDEDEFS